MIHMIEHHQWSDAFTVACAVATGYWLRPRWERWREKRRAAS